MKFCLVLLLLPFILCAQGEGPSEGKRKKGPFKGDMFKDREAKMERMRNMIKERDPERFAELEKLKQEAPEKFREEMRKSVREFAEKFGKGKPPHGPGGDRHWLREMSEKDPEKYAELMKLREEDPQKFRERLGDEFSSRMKKRPMMDSKTLDEIRVATSAYHAASADQKESAKANLRSLLQTSFENDLKSRREMAEKLEKHLSEVKAQIEAREKKSDSVIDERLNFLLEKTSGKKHKKP